MLEYVFDMDVSNGNLKNHWVKFILEVLGADKQRADVTLRNGTDLNRLYTAATRTIGAMVYTITEVAYAVFPTTHADHAPARWTVTRSQVNRM